METEEPMQNVLLVGAYERENFGDLLFLLQTENYLKDFSVTATAPFQGQMQELLGKNIAGYASAVRQYPSKAVWVVGGEVGGTSIPAAFRMSALESDYAGHLNLSKQEQVAELERITQLSVSASPYMPRMSAFPETHHATLVINSVGLSGMKRLIGDRRDETWGAVREAGFISVRDRDSSVLLNKHSISHTLAPDMVHTISLGDVLTGKPEKDLALVQVKGPVLKEHGAAAFARILADSKSLKRFRIRLFTAGSATGHDDPDLYEEVVREFRKIAPARHIEISTMQLPLDKAREIANCGLWVGTSLHGLIISTAFDVPRVGLELNKLVKYATSWDETMPIGVKLADLDAAVDSALVSADAARASQRSIELAHLAEESITAAIRVLHDAGDFNELGMARQKIAQKMAFRRSMPWRKAHRMLSPLG